MHKFSSSKSFVLPFLCGALATPVLIAPAHAAPAAPQAIGLSGTLPDLKTVQVDSGHVYDYTFTTAPTDWWTQSGIWEMTNRWSCSPGWSWFGGRSDETAAVWNKRRFAGDVSVQFYFAFKMGLAGSSRWDESPSNTAVTICGDGRNVGSGYSFIVGADNNEHSILMRGAKVVAESHNAASRLSTPVDGRPDDSVLHRRWWYMKVNKIGPRVECWLDNKLLFSYDDPQPLDMGQVALWTYDNGIMLSRVQIYYANEVRPDYVKLVSQPTLSAPKAKSAVQVASAKAGPARHASVAKGLKVAALSRGANGR